MVTLMYVMAIGTWGIGIFAMMGIRNRPQTYAGVEAVIIVSMLWSVLLLLGGIDADFHHGDANNYAFTVLIGSYLIWASVQCHRVHLWRRLWNPTALVDKPRSLQMHAWLITRVLRYGLIRPVAHLHLFTTHRVTGLENLPKRGGVIVVGNHPSQIDPLVVATTLDRNVTFLAKAELWRVPVLNWFLRLMGQIPVDRGNRESGAKAQYTALKVLQYSNQKQEDKGGVVIAYPEGGCTPETGELRPFKKGVWYLAKESGAPVVTFGISGTRDIRLNPLTIIHRKYVAHIDLNFGPPLYASQFIGPNAENQFMEELRRRIEYQRTRAFRSGQQV